MKLFGPSSSTTFIITAFILSLIIIVHAKKEGVKNDTDKGRAGKLLSMFQIVSFPNDACVASASKNGTCYTVNECKSKGGVNAGSCANGYGVCCTFTLNAGGTTRENNTYVESTGTVVAGHYVHTICPLNNNICQLRLDFDTFMIADPYTSTNSETSILNGAPALSLVATLSFTFASRCLVDSFAVTNSGGSNTPVICGTNSGQHMYVDVDPSGSKGCNDLVFQIGTGSTATTSRQWKIKASQLSCDSLVLAPSGCTQYFLEKTGTVQTYNYGGKHLADQKQTICVRREKGQCRICWMAVAAIDFGVSGTAASMGITTGSFCCGGGTAMGKNTKGYDCLQIPGAMKFAPVGQTLLPASRFCGDLLVSTMAAIAPVSICSSQTPFYIRFLSDGYEELLKESLLSNVGFKLTYNQDAISCPIP